MNEKNDKQADKRISSFLSSVDSSIAPPDKQSLNKLQEQSTAEFLASSADRNLQPEKTRTISLWKTIMKSKITKLAAAAVIIVGTLLSMILFDKTGAPAFGMAEVMAAMTKAEWMHMTYEYAELNTGFEVIEPEIRPSSA